ncbi:MAG: short-chain dehydrogenase/reductase SDR [bacterium]|nr:MAG: short-chain dehydrogenase/reductase SDR [bacterium]
MNLENRVILIAGSTGALGSAVTGAFLGSGARVGALHRGPPPPTHERLIPLEADVTRTDQVTRAVTQLVSETGRIDALINTVGGYASTRLAETTDEEWHRLMALNLDSAMVLSRAVLPHMMARGDGRLIHVASKAALEPFPGAAAYLVSKAALVGLVKVLAVELAGSGVTANVILPGIIDTPANRADMPTADMSNWVPPGDVARLMLELCAPGAGHRNGELIIVG